MNVNLMYTIDTNIFIYAFDVRFPDKHSVAEEIVAHLMRQRGIIPLQSLTEFYAACSRKRIITLDAATNAVQKARVALKVVPAASTDIPTAIGLHSLHNIQFFDALLIATATRAGCTIFFSEDLQDGQTFGPLTIRNPFKMAEAELTTLLT
jgi:predicted nucleic acid-binding protein